MVFKNIYFDFAAICVLKAVMDFINFATEKNTGFWSITSGWFDGWHISGWIIMLIVGVNFVFFYFKNSSWQINLLRLGLFGIIAFVIQTVLYNWILT